MFSFHLSFALWQLDCSLECLPWDAELQSLPARVVSCRLTNRQLEVVHEYLQSKPRLRTSGFTSLERERSIIALVANIFVRAASRFLSVKQNSAIRPAPYARLLLNLHHSRLQLRQPENGQIHDHRPLIESVQPPATLKAFA